MKNEVLSPKWLYQCPTSRMSLIDACKIPMEQPEWNRTSASRRLNEAQTNQATRHLDRNGIMGMHHSICTSERTSTRKRKFSNNLTSDRSAHYT